MQFKIEKKTLIGIGASIVGVILLVWGLNNWQVLSSGLGNISNVFSPLILGFCIAFVLNIPMRFFESHIMPKSKNKIWLSIRRPLCIVIALLVIISIFALIIMLVVPEVLGAFQVLADSIPVAVNGIIDWASNNSASYPEIESMLSNLQIDWGKTGREVLTYLTNGATSLVSSTVQVVGAVFGGVTNAIIAFIFGLYILLGKEKLRSQFVALFNAILPKKVAKDIFFVTNLAKHTFGNFVTGQCIEAAILGCLCWAGMAIFQFPYAPMVGALVGITALIPIVGAFIGCIVGAFMILMISPIQAFWFVVFFLCLQQFEGNIIYPRVVGSSIGLPGLWVLAGVTIGGNLFGIMGMLFGVPLCSVLYSLTRLFVKERQAKAALGASADLNEHE